MIEAKLYDYDEKEYGIYCFKDISELTDYLEKYNVMLIWKREI